MQCTVDLWLWQVIDPVSRRSVVTHCRMAESDALDLDPAAQRIEGSLERRTVWIDPDVADWAAGLRLPGQASGEREASPV